MSNLRHGNKDGAEVPTPIAEGQSNRRFGPKLRELRESYWERVTQSGPPGVPAPKMRLSALALIACMKEAGYDAISSGTYSEIEAGNIFPRDFNRFLNTAAACLRLSDEDVEQLRYALAYDLVVPKLGAHLVDDVLMPPSALAKPLRTWRERKHLKERDLAICLIKHGFRPINPHDEHGTPHPEELSPEELAEYISLIEEGGSWPFKDDERALFIAACRRCLGVEAKADLVKGMTKDFNRKLRAEDE